MICPTCREPVDDHELEDAWVCLDALSAAALELAQRTCGGMTPAIMERELRRPSAGWRTPIRERR